MAFKISKSTEYGILWCRSEGKSVDEIHEELNISKNTIEEVFANHPVEADNGLPSDKERSFYRPTEGVAALTKEGAQIAETIKACPPARPEAIFRPNG